MINLYPSKLNTERESKLNTIQEVVNDNIPDNNQQLITAELVRNSFNSSCDNISLPYLEALTDKVEIRMFTGYEIVKGDRYSTDIFLNTDVIRKTKDDDNKVFVVKLPWNSTVYFNNYFDDNEFMCIFKARDNGGFYTPPVTEDTLTPYVFYDEEGNAYQYRVQDGRQTDEDFTTTFIPYDELVDSDNEHIYIVAQFGTDEIANPAYFPDLAVNGENIIYDLEPADKDINVTAIVDKKNFESAVSQKMQKNLNRYNFNELTSLLTSNLEHFTIDDMAVKYDANSRQYIYSTEIGSTIGVLKIEKGATLYIELPRDLVGRIAFVVNADIVEDGDALRYAELYCNAYDFLNDEHFYVEYCRKEYYIRWEESLRGERFYLFNTSGNDLYLIWQEQIEGSQSISPYIAYNNQEVKKYVGDWNNYQKVPLLFNWIDYTIDIQYQLNYTFESQAKGINSVNSEENTEENS